MQAAELYRLIAGMFLIVLLLLSFLDRNRTEKTTSLAYAAFAFVITGILLGQEGWIGKSLLVIGVVLSLLDIILINSTKKTVR